MTFQLADGSYEGEQLGFVGALISGLLPIATQAISARLTKKYRGQVAASNMSVAPSQSGISPATAAKLVSRGGRGMRGAMQRVVARQVLAQQAGAVPAPPQALVPAGFSPVSAPQFMGAARFGPRMAVPRAPGAPPAMAAARRGLDPMMLLALAVPAVLLLRGR